MDDPHTDGRRDPIDLVAQRGFGEHGQDPAAPPVIVIGPPCGRRHDRVPPVANADLWTDANLCDNIAGRNTLSMQVETRT